MNAEPVQQTETLVLPATKQQPLRLELGLDVGSGTLHCAAYVRHRPFHIVFAVAHKTDDWRIDKRHFGNLSLWIGSAAFDIDPKHVEKVRAFLAHTKAGQ